MKTPCFIVFVLLACYTRAEHVMGILVSLRNESMNEHLGVDGYNRLFFLYSSWNAGTPKFPSRHTFRFLPPDSVPKLKADSSHLSFNLLALSTPHQMGHPYREGG
jgi:hypothetical protein